MTARKINNFLKTLWHKLTDKSKKKLIISFVWLVLSLIVVPHIVAFIINTIDSANELKDKGRLFDLPKYIKLDANIQLNNYKTFFDFNDSFELLGLGAIAFVFIYLIGEVIINLLSKKETFEDAVDYASHGSARWSTEDEIKENYYTKNKKGWFIGAVKDNLLEDKYFKLDMKAVYIPFQADYVNSQVIAFGAPNCQKTTTLILPNILNICHQYKSADVRPDMIITDPKTEIWKYSNNYLKANGYDVYVLDFINQETGHSLNPIDYIKDDITRREICKNLIHSMAEGASGEMVFWQNQEYQILAALVGFVQQNKDCQKTLYEVYKILKSENARNIEIAETFFDDYKISGMALELWESFLMGSESPRTKSGIMLGLAEKLNMFGMSGIQRLTNETTLPIENLGVKKEKPMAVFIFIPDSNKAFRPIINMFLSIMLKQLNKAALKNGSSLEVPVHLMLDEMANIGSIPDIEEMLGTMRGKKIYPLMILQSYPQLKERYPKSYQDIVSQCDNILFVGVNDNETAKYCSTLLGQTTIKIKGTSEKSTSGVFEDTQKRDSDQYQSRDLLQPSEVIRFNKEYMIMVRQGIPSKLLKIQYNFWDRPLKEESSVYDFTKLRVNLDKQVSFLDIQQQEINEAHRMLKLREKALAKKDKELVDKYDKELKEKAHLLLHKKKEKEDVLKKIINKPDNKNKISEKLLKELSKANEKGDKEEIEKIIKKLQTGEKAHDAKNYLDEFLDMGD